MFKKINEFEKQRPYLAVLLSIGIGAILGITLNFIFGGTFDFREGFYFTVFFTTVELLRVRRNLVKNKKNRH